MDQEVENLNSPNGDQETDNSTNVEQEAESSTEQPEYTEREKQYYARIKKLEQDLKEAKEGKTAKVETTATNGLSLAETIALSKADIAPEDIEDVLEYAQFKRMGVIEALKSPVMKATLAEKAEHRKSASAVSTGSGRRAGSAAISDDRLMSDAAKGIMPESEADMARLQELRFKGRK